MPPLVVNRVRSSRYGRHRFRSPSCDLTARTRSTRTMFSVSIAKSRKVTFWNCGDGNDIASLGCDVVVVEEVVSESFDANFSKASVLEHLESQFFTPDGS